MTRMIHRWHTNPLHTKFRPPVSTSETRVYTASRTSHNYDKSLLLCQMHDLNYYDMFGVLIILDNYIHYHHKFRRI